jgi:hypothetical protein
MAIIPIGNADIRTGGLAKTLIYDLPLNRRTRARALTSSKVSRPARSSARSERNSAEDCESISPPMSPQENVAPKTQAQDVSEQGQMPVFGPTLMSEDPARCSILRRNFSRNAGKSQCRCGSKFQVSLPVLMITQRCASQKTNQ